MLRDAAGARNGLDVGPVDADVAELLVVEGGEFTDGAAIVGVLDELLEHFRFPFFLVTLKWSLSSPVE